MYTDEMKKWLRDMIPLTKGISLYDYLAYQLKDCNCKYKGRILRKAKETATSNSVTMIIPLPATYDITTIFTTVDYFVKSYFNMKRDTHVLNKFETIDVLEITYVKK